MRIEGMLFYLVDRAIRSLRQGGLRARTLRVRLRCSDGVEDARSITFGASAYDGEIQPLVRRVFRELYVRRVTVRFVGIQFSNLESADGQLGLFDDPKVASFHAAVDAVRDKHGHGAIVSGRSIALLGTLPKDAYGYVLRTPSLTK